MKSWIKYGIILLAMGCASIALSEHFGALPSLMGNVNFPLLGGVILGLVFYQVWNAGVWSEVLACLYTPKKRMDCARIWLESESLKWLPGALWSYGSRVLLSSEIGLSKKKASSSMVLELMITNVAWALLAATVFISFPVYQWVERLGESFNLLLLVGLAVICVGGALAVMVAKMDKLRAFLSLGPVDFRKCLRTTGHYLVLCVFNASLLWGLMAAVPGVGVPYLAVLGVAGAAWVAGFWAIGIPGGIGVREAVIVTLLCQYTSIEQAILVAALWRGCQMIAEVVSIFLVVGTGAIKRAKLAKNQKREECCEKSSLSY